MKIVAINGSPNGADGTTGSTLAAVLESAAAAGADTELFELGTLSVGPCISCYTCQRTGECVIDDDYQEIKAAMLAADGIIFATPNYIYNVSAQIKALLDRSFSMIHCQSLHGKYGACVLATGGPGFQMPEDYLMHITGIFGYWKVGSLVVAGMQLADADRRKEALADAAALGRRLAEAIKNQQRFPEQEEARMQTFEGMRWMVEQEKKNWPYEYNYWQTHWGKADTE
ncbi:MAG: flavodoxin family protein [Deltaproteobacteria bacterium]|nr:flavodoxin family protein [Deltaproteobacteria bacterium]